MRVVVLSEGSVHYCLPCDRAMTLTGYDVIIREDILPLFLGGKIAEGDQSVSVRIHKAVDHGDEDEELPCALSGTFAPRL
jgi:hypothetical protein